MDTLRGNFADRTDLDQADDFDLADENAGRDAPPPEIGQDERRMQVRAYNHWAGLLEDRNFPSIDDLDPDSLPDFGPYSVLLDFSAGIEDPGISYVGEEIAKECGTEDEFSRLSDVPPRSLLSRITDHYMQIIANQAPIGFEAEFINQDGVTILYRGILLPFSSDDDTIDFIYGVINWKELADQKTTDELMLEVDQALEEEDEAPVEQREDVTPMTDWADGPASLADMPVAQDNDIVEIETASDEQAGSDGAIPAPTFGATEPQAAPGPVVELELEDTMELDADMAAPEAAQPAPIPQEYDPDRVEETLAPVAGDLAGQAEPTEIELPEFDESEMELGDWLASARELALAARSSEDRTRNALYDAISRAYDFSLAATEAPGEFNELVEDSGLTIQDRAPMTPVVKLVFGVDYDKTRLTEYAAALTHAHRLELSRGSLGDYLRAADGGLKGVVKAERRLRREEAGQAVEAPGDPRERIAKKLRKLDGMHFDAIPSEGKEFGLVMIRRLTTGEVVVLSEVPDDVSLVEKAARKLLD